MFDGLTSKQKIITIVIISIISISICVYIYNKSQNYNDIEEGEVLVSNRDSENIVAKREYSGSDSEEIIVVHVAGEVKKPGIVKLVEGQRVEDAINAAGGLSENADVSNINLAYVLEDGTKINIPNKDDEIEEYITDSIGENIIENNNKNDGKEEKNMININKANQSELETLQGIGPSLAIRIIEYRDQNGKFNSIEDIKNVTGIGNSKFEGIKDSISVK